ncbi:hypothetical protein [Rathayibacter sp. AY1E9]|nr:hypothetical protein [Rathayibacter sp. AY1E9]
MTPEHAALVAAFRAALAEDIETCIDTLKSTKRKMPKKVAPLPRSR